MFFYFYDMDSKLVLIVTHQGHDIPLGEFDGKISKLGLISESMSDINGVQRTADFYLDHLHSERENPADVRILIAGIGVPILQLASRLPILMLYLQRTPIIEILLLLEGRCLREHVIFPRRMEIRIHGLTLHK